ncbi:MAG: HAD family hydrolase [Sedimentisphaerales bacterium]|nr:HAD family hydrolase [Sedimentisphaerales bacterium]
MSDVAQTIRAVVFDLDDTLYPERDYVRSGYRVIAADLAGGDWNPDRIFALLWRQFEQGDRRRVFNAVLRRMGRRDSPEEIARLVAIYRGHRPDLSLEVEVGQSLSRLRPRYRLGLITDGFLPAQRLKVEALGLPPYFDHIIYTEELGRDCWKPAPQAFDIMSRTLQCPAPACLYVADNPAKDFLAPNRLGWRTVQLQLPGQVHDGAIPPAGGAAGDTVGTWSELRRLLAIPAD